MSILILRGSTGGGGGGGTLVDGQSASISGSGFGSTAPVIIAWDTFESGSNGSTVATPEVGNAYLSDLTRPLYTTSLAHSGSKCAIHSNGVGHEFSPLSSALDVNSTLKVYFHCWVRRTAYAGGGALKMISVIGTDPQADISPGYRAGGFVDDWWGSYISRDPDGDQTGVYQGDLSSLNADVWNEVELIAKQSSAASVADADVRLYFNRVIEFSRQNVVTRNSTRRWGTFEINSGTTNFSTYPTLYTDELLLQHNWSRVVLCNASTYASSTVRVPQRVTSWGATAINYTVFKAGLSSGTVYEVVIDDTDTVVQTTTRTLQ